MANRERDEVSLVVGGRAYTFVLDLNAMVALEDLFSGGDESVTFQTVLDHVRLGSPRHIRAFLHACLMRHHADLTVEQAGALINSENVDDIVRQLLRIAQRSASADAADVKTLGLDKRPRTAQARVPKRGTGTRSIATRVKSA